MKSLLIAAVIGLAAPSLAWAESKNDKVAPEVQIALQSALQSYLGDIFFDGSLSYIDTSSGDVQTVFPAAVHPIVVPFGTDFFLCSEVITEAGDAVTADFLVRQIDGEFRVVQRLIGQRDVVKKAMSRL